MGLTLPICQPWRAGTRLSRAVLDDHPAGAAGETVEDGWPTQWFVSGR